MARHNRGMAHRTKTLVLLSIGLIGLLLGGTLWVVEWNQTVHTSAAVAPAASVSNSAQAALPPTYTLTPMPTSTESAPPASTSTPTSGAPPTASTIPAASPQMVYYTVAPGDNLTKIAAWFKLANYHPLYDWNTTVIGSNPNLIFPGQVLVVALST